MIRPLTADQLARVLFVAATQVGVTECPPNTNSGLKVEDYLAITGLGKGNPWCAAFVAWVGVTALGAAWPVPRVAGCASLGDWGQRESVLQADPQVGAIGLLWYASKARFAHTFFIEGRPDLSGAWSTIEANTSGGGSREGWGVFRRRRKFAPEDRFLVLGPVAW